MTTPRAGAPYPTSHVEAALRVAPVDVHEALGLIPYLGYGPGRDKHPPVARTPADWFGETVDVLGQPNGPMVTPAHQPLHGPWAT